MKTINKKHLLFIKSMIEGKDKTEAYSIAYPDACGEALRTGAARLYATLRREIEPELEQIQAAVLAEARITGKEHAKEAYAGLHDKRIMLASIIRDERKTKRHMRLADRIEQVYDDLNANIIIRAIEVDTKLENNWYTPIPKSLQEKPAKEEKPKLFTCDGFDVYINRITSPDDEISLRHFYIIANPDKCEYYTTSAPDCISQVGYTVFLQTPPWRTDPGWYDKQRQLRKLNGPFDEDFEHGREYIWMTPAEHTNWTPPTVHPTRPSTVQHLLKYYPDANGNIYNEYPTPEETQPTPNDTLAPNDLCLMPETQLMPYDLCLAPPNPYQSVTIPINHICNPDEINEEPASPPPIPTAQLQEELRQKGYKQVDELYKEAWVQHMYDHQNNQYKEIHRIKEALHLPPDRRKETEQATGWRFHPIYPGYVRKSHPYENNT